MSDVCFHKPISAVDWDISQKFGLDLEFDLSNWAKSPIRKLKVELPRRICNLEKSMWRHNYAGPGLYDLDEI